MEALGRGDMSTARRLVNALFVDDRERTARQRLEAGEGLAALDAIDEALELDLVGRERKAAMLMVRGRAAFAAASASPRYASLFEEALETFELAAEQGAGVSAALRASRAARMLNLNQQALDDARAAVNWIDAVPGRSSQLDVDQPFARTWGEAAFSRYVEHRQASDGAPGSLQLRTSLFGETRRAIERSIGESPTDPWGYEQLSNLFLWEQRGPEALQTLRTALAILPENERIHTAFVRQLGDLTQAQGPRPLERTPRRRSRPASRRSWGLTPRSGSATPRTRWASGIAGSRPSIWRSTNSKPRRTREALAPQGSAMQSACSRPVETANPASRTPASTTRSSAERRSAGASTVWRRTRTPRRCSSPPRTSAPWAQRPPAAGRQPAWTCSSRARTARSACPRRSRVSTSSFGGRRPIRPASRGSSAGRASPTACSPPDRRTPTSRTTWAS